MSLVVGTDLSELSLAALRAALALAKRRGDTKLSLVHACDAVGGDAAQARLVEAARARLEADAARLGAGTGIEVRTEVLVGQPDEALTAYAETEGADLLLVTSQGAGMTPTRRLGGVSQRLATRARVPLVVVRDAEPLLAWAAGERPLRVMIGVDDSAACEAAIQFARALRRCGPVDLVIGHVYFPDEAAERYGLRHVSMVEPTPQLEALLVRDLRRRLGEVPGEGAIEVVASLGLGRIGDHMLEIADARRVDLVVVGNRHRAGLNRLSSVSAVILDEARQSVACVPLDPHAALDAVPAVRVTVVATDRSAFGNLAIPWAYGLVGDPGGRSRAEVHIVHVVGEDADPAADAAIVEELLALAPPSRMGVLTRAHVVHGGDAAETIAEAAERIGADVICIATHGRSGLSRALVGSVADRLIRACRRPVLVLRPQE